MEFKLRLERQGCRYFFRWSYPCSLFDEEQMRSLTGVSSARSMVFRSIWPMLCKGNAKKWTAVEKEVVQLTNGTNSGLVSATDLPMEFSSLSL